jgi:hypothetical protein
MIVPTYKKYLLFFTWNFVMENNGMPALKTEDRETVAEAL